MIKVASVAALLAGAILLSPTQAAWAISSESSEDTGSGAQVVDPDDQTDQIANPGDGTAGSATIEIPPINVPGEDSGDYSPPESEDDSSGDTSSDGTTN